MRKIIVGSRKSKLAMTQSQQFIDKLKEKTSRIRY